MYDNFDNLTVDELHQGNLAKGLQPHEDPENLRVLYQGLGWTQEEIAGFYEVDRSTIAYHLDKHDIDTRGRYASRHVESKSLDKLRRLQRYDGQRQQSSDGSTTDGHHNA